MAAQPVLFGFPLKADALKKRRAIHVEHHLASCSFSQPSAGLPQVSRKSTLGIGGRETGETVCDASPKVSRIFGCVLF